MRPRDENKHRSIIAAAGRLFSSKPFHLVRLDEVAQAAGVGKGTLYIYFKSKEDLYFGLVYDGFADLVRHLKERIIQDGLDPTEKIRVIVKALIDFSVSCPQLVEVMRTAGVPDADSKWGGKRRELLQLIENTIRDGANTPPGAGRLVDDRPDLTALYILSMVRAILLYGTESPESNGLSEHAAGLILHGIAKGRR
jgi:AcrR family transcriptional regulator